MAREVRVKRPHKPSKKHTKALNLVDRHSPRGRVAKRSSRGSIDVVKKRTNKRTSKLTSKGTSKLTSKPVKTRSVAQLRDKPVSSIVPTSSRKRASAEKGFRGRSVLDINILRLLGLKLPTMTGLAEPPGDVGHFYGLTDESGRRTFILNDDLDVKRRPASPNYRVFASAQEAHAYAKAAPGTLRIVFTDGSHFPRSGKTGYAVWWGPGHANNAAGPVPADLPLSSARAEEYAIFLALLQIKLETQYANEVYKYEIRTDSTWTIGYISKWFRKWDKANSSVGWKTPPTKSTSQRDVLRVSAGILWDLRFSGINVQFAYVPGHEGIEGNEMANLMCRHAARSGETTGLRPVAF